MATTDGTMAAAGPSSSSSAAAAAAAAAYEASLPPTDALPYYDDELSRPGMQAKVERELAAEMKGDAAAAAASSAASVSEDRLPPALELFADRPALRAELQRVAAQGVGSAGAIDKTRYQLAGPAAALDASSDEWEAALRNAEAQLMHSAGRLTNLELLKKFGANHWRLHNFQQEAFVRGFEGAANTWQADTASINRARKAEQTAAGAELSRMSRRWAELLNRSLSVELANVVAAGEIQDLEARRETLRQKVAAADATGA